VKSLRTPALDDSVNICDVVIVLVDSSRITLNIVHLFFGRLFYDAFSVTGPYSVDDRVKSE
jgi:hypothetical protein